MTLAEADLSRFLLSAGLLLLAALAVGELFARYRQPRVIGEILGGLLLGPSLFGAIAPQLQEKVFLQIGPSASALGAIYQLGLIWLMFAAGTELRRLPVGRERVTAVSILVAGTILPFALGLALFVLAQPPHIAGPEGNTTALALVFAAAIAVTSIPVISRIMLDLGLMSTALARVVLGAAVFEDIVMFAVLGVAIGITQSSAENFGLAAALKIHAGSPLSAFYYLCVVGAALAAGSLLAWRGAKPASLMRRIAGDIRLELLFVLVTVAACLFVNVPPLFGGLVAGLAVGGCGELETTERVKAYGLAFFVPIYFAIVGVRLDLLHAFQPAFFVAFFLFACGVKGASVYLGARLSGESFRSSRNYAIAMNARGGPGIILATVALDAGIINANFYASLVMLAILSSLLAGWWLEHALVPRSSHTTLPRAVLAEDIPPSPQMKPAADWGTP